MHQDDELYNQLAFYTLAHSDPAFIHQLVVDAYTAQHADENTKPIAVIFALIGLYLHLEKGYTGKQVQRAHMQLAKWPNNWPKLPLPSGHAEIGVQQILAIEPGPARDAMIDRWCASVWKIWRDSWSQIIEISRKYLGTD
jgi:hypothetical protein